MYKYTIKYQYGTYSGTREIYADDEDQAIAKLWRELTRYSTLSMAYRSATIISTEEA